MIGRAVQKCPAVGTTSLLAMVTNPGLRVWLFASMGASVREATPHASCRCLAWHQQSSSQAGLPHRSEKYAWRARCLFAFALLGEDHLTALQAPVAKL